MINGIQATGISFGVDRLMLISTVERDANRMLILSIGEDEKAIELASKLREQGENVTMFYGKPTKALEYANSYGIGKVIFIGKEEIKKGKYKVKDMETGKEIIQKF